MGIRKIEREEIIIDLYINQNKNCREISQQLTMQRRMVYRVLERRNIPLKDTVRLFPQCDICSKIVPKNFRKIDKTICGTCTTAIRRYKTKLRAVKYKGGKCCDCNWSGNISCFDFHHKDPEQKDFTLGANIISSISWEKVLIELDKCDLLCSNCHRIRHSNYENEIFLKYCK